MASDAADDGLMALAVETARGAAFRTSPNPMVGCVVAREGRVITAARHELAGQPHAEILALRAAGDAARGADLVVTLEPCTVSGRTPPCVPEVIRSGVRRVVVAMLDPNPRVHGSGVAALRAAGIEVTVGVRGEEAARLVEFYAHHIVSGMPFVTAKFAASLDGRVATAGGESRWITSEAARALGHRLRHDHDAVMVGIGTVLADDPALTARLPAARQPLRVVLDSELRLPGTARLLRDGGRTVVFCAPDAAAERVAALEDRGATVHRIPPAAGGVDVREALQRLGADDVISVLLEGGPRLLGAAFDAGMVQRVVAMLAPRIIGGEAAPAAVGGIGVASLAAAAVLRDVTVERCGPDIVVTGYCDHGASDVHGNC